MTTAHGPRPRALGALTASCRREIAYLTHSPWDLVLLFLLPLAAVVLMGAMFLGGTLQQIPIVVVDQDVSPLSRTIVRKFDDSHKLSVVARPTNLPQAISLVRSAKAYLVVLIPKGFEGEARHRRNPAVVLYDNASFQTVGSQAAGAAQQAVSAALQEGRASLAQAVDHQLLIVPPTVQVTILGNPQQSFELFLEALILPGVMHLLTSCACVGAVGRELSQRSLAAWAEGSGGRLGWALIGKLVPYVAVFSVWGAVWVVWLAGFRGWPIQGSLLAILLGQALLYAATASVAALLVAVTKEPDTAFSISTVYAGSAIAYSNGTLPVSHGPGFAEVWSAFLPFTNYLRLQQQQWVLGSNLVRSAPSAGVLLLFVLIPFVLALLLLKRQAQRPPRRETPPALAPDLPGFGRSYLAALISVATSRSLVSLLVLSVVLYGFYYPLAYAVQTGIKLPTAVVDLDHTPFSRSFIRRLAATRAIAVVSRPASSAEAKRQFREDRVDAVVLIPHGLEAGVLQRGPGGVGLYLTGAYLVRARELGEAVSATLGASVQEALVPVLKPLKLQGASVRIVERPLFNLTNGYGSYTVPGVASIILQQTLLFGCATFAAYRRETQAQWRMRPSGFLGAWAALVSLGCLTSLFYFGFVFWFQDYPRGGDLTGLLLGAVLFSAATSALGLLIGSAFHDHGRVVQILAGTSVPLFFLGGSAWPAFAMPSWVAMLAKLAPSTSAIPGFIKMWADGATLNEAAPELVTLACLALLYGAAAFARFTTVERRK